MIDFGFINIFPFNVKKNKERLASESDGNEIPVTDDFYRANFLEPAKNMYDELKQSKTEKEFNCTKTKLISHYKEYKWAFAGRDIETIFEEFIFICEKTWDDINSEIKLKEALAKPLIYQLKDGRCVKCIEAADRYTCGYHSTQNIDRIIKAEISNEYEGSLTEWVAAECVDINKENISYTFRENN